MSHTVQASHETLARTTLGEWGAGRRVNLERSLRLGDELGGHLVFGHVDAVGEIAAIAAGRGLHRLEIRIPEALAPMLAVKGSIAVDGISLTVNEAGGDRSPSPSSRTPGRTPRSPIGGSAIRSISRPTCWRGTWRGSSPSRGRLEPRRRAPIWNARRRQRGDRRMAGAGAEPRCPTSRVRGFSSSRPASMRQINDLLLAGARAVARGGRRRDRALVVPGALEIPPAIAMALAGGGFEAFVALGCVIRGETTHYELVAGESCRGLMELGIRERRRHRQRHPHRRERGSRHWCAPIRTARTRAAAPPTRRSACCLAPSACGVARHEPAQGPPDPEQAAGRAVRGRAGALPDRADGRVRRTRSAASSCEHRLGRLFEPFETDQPSPAVDREWFEIVVRGAWAAHDRLDPGDRAVSRRGLDLRPLRLSAARLPAGRRVRAGRADRRAGEGRDQRVCRAGLPVLRLRRAGLRQRRARSAGAQPARDRDRAMTLGEFDLIDRLLKPLARGYPGGAGSHRRRGPGRRARRPRAGRGQGRHGGRRPLPGRRSARSGRRQAAAGQSLRPRRHGGRPARLPTGHRPLARRRPMHGCAGSPRACMADQQPLRLPSARRRHGVDPRAADLVAHHPRHRPRGAGAAAVGRHGG